MNKKNLFALMASVALWISSTAADASPPSREGCGRSPGREALETWPGTPVEIDEFSPDTPLQRLSPGGAVSEGGDECVGKIQPGAAMTAPVGCTLNWVFKDSNGSFYIGTAGHCTSHVGEAISAAGVGTFGQVVFRINNGVGEDFALIKIDESLVALVDPTVCHWGGPSTAGNSGIGDTVLVYGFGNVYGESSLTRPRVGQVLFRNDAGHSLHYLGFAQGGDSGMPIMTKEGKATAIHVWSELSVGGLRIDPSRKAGTLLTYALGEASTALNTSLNVQTSQVPVKLLEFPSLDPPGDKDPPSDRGCPGRGGNPNRACASDSGPASPPFDEGGRDAPPAGDNETRRPPSGQPERDDSECAKDDPPARPGDKS